MRIILALHRSKSKLLQRVRNHPVLSKYGVAIALNAVTVKREIRRDPNGTAALILDATFMHLAEEPQIADLYKGPIIGVYANQEEKTAMESIGLTITTETQLMTVVERVLKQPRRSHKKRIVACLAMREPERTRYFNILSKMSGYDLVRCVNAKQALDTVLSNVGIVTLLVVGYESRTIVAKAYSAGYNRGVLAVCEDASKQEILLKDGLDIAGPHNFQELVLRALQR